MDEKPRSDPEPCAPQAGARTDRQNWDIRPGEAVRRADLHDRFGGNRRTRISPSRTTPNVFVFVDAGRVGTARWVGGVLHVPGATIRDRRLGSANRAVIGHGHARRALRVFWHNGDAYVYAGEFRIDPDEPFSFAEPDGTGGASAGIVFRLVPVGARSGAAAARAPVPARAVLHVRRLASRVRPQAARVRSAGRLLRKGVTLAARRPSSRLFARSSGFLRRASPGTTLLLLGSCAAVAETTWDWTSAPVRPAVTTWFLLVCPGLALVRLLPARETLTRLVIAVATSLALEALLATVMVEASAWSPSAALAALIAITAAATVLALWVPPRMHPSTRRMAAPTGWKTR